MGLIFLFASIIPSESNEKTANALSKYNLIGCLFLLFYSIVFLDSLCPLCTLYYLLSAIASYLLWKGGYNTWKPNLKIIAIWGAISSIISIILINPYPDCVDCDPGSTEDYPEKITKEYYELSYFGDPSQESPFKIHTSTKKFSDAPIRISIFSDFECPFCKVVADQMNDLKRRYGEHLNIQYFFYPLDKKCNKDVTKDFHENSCYAAQLVACAPENFSKLHDEIFNNQERIKDGFLTEFATKNNIVECFRKGKSKDLVLQSIDQAKKYQIKSTPTIIINGRKIEGSLPLESYSILFEAILKKRK
jgi:predicted DsbA family dithiol-disulfide isomerase